MWTMAHLRDGVPWIPWPAQDLGSFSKQILSTANAGSPSCIDPTATMTSLQSPCPGTPPLPVICKWKHRQGCGGELLRKASGSYCWVDNAINPFLKTFFFCSTLCKPRKNNAKHPLGWNEWYRWVEYALTLNEKPICLLTICLLRKVQIIF